MARARRYTRKVGKKALKYGKVFRTRSGRLGRYVYRFGKRVAFEGVRSGARRYVAERTYRTLKRRY